ncbi:MAG: HEAT repeat domain-containing protein [Planctomycetota bacterium]
MNRLLQYAFVGVLACTVLLVHRSPRTLAGRGVVTGDDKGVLPLSPHSVPGAASRPAPPATLRWEEGEYDLERGIRVLLALILDERADPLRRERALDTLGRLNTRLQEAECVPEIVTLYPSLSARDLQGAALICLCKSEDVRGLPLFSKVLQDEHDPLLRLLAAVGLTQWNIRTGVQELLVLFDSDAQLPNKRTLADEAAINFSFLNRTKGWGFPERELRDSILKRTDIKETEKTHIWIEEHKNWFENNRDRFPDWKPGDPLPHIDTPAEQNGGAAQEFPNDTRTLMDSESGELFVIPTTELKPYPMPNPKTRKNTLYRTEICYWGEECRKRGGTRMIMNTLLGKPEPTHCPVCGHVVRFCNPRPEDRNPSDQAE